MCDAGVYLEWLEKDIFNLVNSNKIYITQLRIQSQSFLLTFSALFHYKLRDVRKWTENNYNSHILGYTSITAWRLLMGFYFWIVMIKGEMRRWGGIGLSVGRWWGDFLNACWNSLFYWYNIMVDYIMKQHYGQSFDS